MIEAGAYRETGNADRRNHAAVHEREFVQMWWVETRIWGLGGESGIRTHGRLITYFRFQDERDRPLRHLPVPVDQYSRKCALFRASFTRIL